jgi:hypothetical protein
MRKIFVIGLVGLAGLFSLHARAQSDAAIDKALANMPVEKIMHQMLGSVDVSALTQQIEQAAKDVASGKTPDLANTQALQDMQAKMQKNMAEIAPDLARTLLGLIGPLMTEMKSEMANLGKEGLFD